MGEAVRCFATLVLTSVPLSAVMLIMVRYAALPRPASVTLVGGLAIAAIPSTALSLFHDLDAAVMVLIRDLGITALIVALTASLGRRLLSRMAPPRGPMRRA